MRIFLAVFPPPAAQAAAHRVTARLRRAHDDVAWVRRENLHYTLRFMGELDLDEVSRVIDAARAGASGHPVFSLRLGAGGAFPEARRARVLWLAAATGGDRLEALARSLEDALTGRGFDPAGRAFTPHLTLGRVRGGGQDWAARLAAAAPGAEGAEAPPFAVDRVAVVHSTLASGGSIYRVRAEAPLAGREGGRG